MQKRKFAVLLASCFVCMSGMAAPSDAVKAAYLAKQAEVNNAYNGDQTKLVLKSVIEDEEITFNAEQAAEKSDDELNRYIAVYDNALSIYNHNNVATQLWTNIDFTQTTTHTFSAVGGSSANNGTVPAGWEFSCFEDENVDDFEAVDKSVARWHDTFVSNGEFQFKIGDDGAGQLKQTVSNLPNGTYKITADVATGTGNDRLIALYGNSGEIFRSENIHPDATDVYNNYEMYARSTSNHELEVGIRSDNGYFKIKNITIEFVADNAEKVDNAMLYQAVYSQRGDTQGSGLQLYAYTHANGCKLTNITNPNTVAFVASAGAVIYSGNVAVQQADESFVCDNLVLTDAKVYGTVENLTATTVTYTRNLRNGANDWNTYFAPFACSLPEGVTAYQYTGMNDAGDGLMVEAVESLQADKAYLMKSTVAQATFTAQNAEMGMGMSDEEEGLFGFTLLYDGITADDGYYMLSKNDNMFHLAADGSCNTPFRAMFAKPSTDDSDADGDATQSRLRVIIGGQTGIKELNANETEDNATVYTLGGQAVNRKANNLQPGVYVVNHKKVIIK